MFAESSSQLSMEAGVEAKASIPFLSKDIEILKKIKQANEKGVPILFMEGLQDLLEKLIIFEYNQGSYKRVNPLVEQSELYQHYVAQ